MHPTRRAVLGAVTTVAIAGCVGGDGDGDGDGDDGGMATDTEATETPTGTDDTSATVQVSSHEELGDILVGADGMTLYMFDQDTEGDDSSACSGDCASAWPPLTVEDTPTAGDEVTAELTTFDREDGSTQVAAGGWPLYYFANDENPGDANGQGANDVWWVLDPDGSPVRSTSSPTETDANAY